MRNLLARDGVRRLVRYAAVSGGSIVLTQVLLVGLLTSGVTPSAANVGAVLGAAVPIYAVNRRWVWRLTGRSDLRREVVPFWACTIAGLVLSTAAVAVVARTTDDPLLLSATNIAAFGVLWLVKFFVLDAYVFGRTAPADRAPVIDDAELAAFLA